MPHSWHYPTGPMLEFIFRCQPASVADIGPGFGKWGYLARDMLDFNEARLERTTWTAKIDGFEAFGYESPLLDWVYNRVIRGDAQENVAEIAGYDLVILADVIEHFEKSSGEALLDELLRTNKNVLVSTPTTFFTQEIADNPFEAHLSLWTIDDFVRRNGDVEVSSGSLVALMGGVGSSLPKTEQVRSTRLLAKLRFLRERGMAFRAGKMITAAVLRHLP